MTEEIVVSVYLKLGYNLGEHGFKSEFASRMSNFNSTFYVN